MMLYGALAPISTAAQRRPARRELERGGSDTPAHIAPHIGVRRVDERMRLRAQPAFDPEDSAHASPGALCPPLSATALSSMQHSAPSAAMPASSASSSSSLPSPEQLEQLSAALQAASPKHTGTLIMDSSQGTILASSGDLKDMGERVAAWLITILQDTNGMLVHSDTHAAAAAAAPSASTAAPASPAQRDEVVKITSQWTLRCMRWICANARGCSAPELTPCFPVVIVRLSLLDPQSPSRPTPTPSRSRTSSYSA